MHGLKVVACDYTLMVGWIQDGVSKVRGRIVFWPIRWQERRAELVLSNHDRTVENKHNELRSGLQVEILKGIS